jgi:DMSO/TMAO reductase YedYZ molybdopterin-dependent catalytic subunit
MTKDNKSKGLSRRQFNRIAGVGVVGAAMAPAAARMALAEAAPNPADIIKGVNETMRIHNAKLGVMETPLQLLREHAITPKDLMYIRNHFPPEGRQAWMATTEAPDITEWDIRIGGLAVRPRTITLDDLKGMEQVKVEAVMQCAGNGRSYYAAKAKAPGGQWKHGGMANVEWEGVPLKAVLDRANVGPADSAKWLTANGADESPAPKGADLIKSFHVGDPALDSAILAMKMNGEPIPAVHGGPVRLIIPGYYGNMNVKFVNELLYETEQSPSPFQSKAYRAVNRPVEPGSFSVKDYNLGNSKPTYGFKIMSVIFAPLAEDMVKAGPVEVRGVAWNDGTSPITSVKVSQDGGKIWKAADLTLSDSPFAWHHWSLKTTLAAGKHTLRVIATDAAGRSQPLDGTARWNPKGYEWNGVDTVTVTAS